MQDIQMLQSIYKTAVMGMQGLDDVLDKDKAQELQSVLLRQRQEYEEISQSSAQLLRSRGEQPRGPSPAAQFSARMMTSFKTLTGSTTGKIAEMAIKGNSMGIAKSTRRLRSYTGDDPQVRGLANRLLQTEKANARELEEYR